MVVLGNRLPAAAKPGAPKPLNLPSKQSENGNGACPRWRPSPLLALPIPLSSPPAGHTDGVTGEPTGGEGGAPAPKDPNESAWGVDLAADAAAQRELEFVKEAEEAKREQQAKALEGGIKAQQRAVAAAVKDAKAELRRQFAIEKEELRRSLNETHEAALEAARRSR